MPVCPASVKMWHVVKRGNGAAHTAPTSCPSGGVFFRDLRMGCVPARVTLWCLATERVVRLSNLLRHVLDADLLAVPLIVDTACERGGISGRAIAWSLLDRFGAHRA